jgi:regulator of sigma E protease
MNLLLLLAIVLFVLLVIVHELGHFLLARRNGVEVEEFGIGFPPRLWGKRLKSGLLLSINLLPLGGFVRLKGESDSARSEGSFGAARLRAKTKILLAGVAVNFITALVLFTVIGWIGMPRLIENQFTIASDERLVRNEVIIASVSADSPADKAGVQMDDRVTRVAGVQIDDEQDLVDTTKAHAGQTITVMLVRDEQPLELAVTLLDEATVAAARDSDNPRGYLGVIPGSLQVVRYGWSAPVVAVGVSAQFSKLTLQGLGNVLADLFAGRAGEAADNVAGPVRTFQILNYTSTLGLSFVLMIMALISLTLAIMNALPVPALDGGRLALILFYRARRKALTERIENRVHGSGFVILILLSIVITIREVMLS